MGYVRQVKERMVNELAKRYSSYRNFVVVDFRGLRGVQASALRKELRIEGVRMNIVKNAVARFAFEKLGLAELSKAMEGMNAIVYGEDAAVMAKKITEFVEKTKTLKIKGGLIEGRAVEAPAIRDLAQLPSKKDLQAMFVGTLASPASTFVGTLQSVLGTFVRTLAAVEEKLPKA